MLKWVKKFGILFLAAGTLSLIGCSNDEPFEWEDMTHFSLLWGSINEGYYQAQIEEIEGNFYFTVQHSDWTPDAYGDFHYENIFHLENVPITHEEVYDITRILAEHHVENWHEFDDEGDGECWTSAGHISMTIELGSENTIRMGFLECFAPDGFFRFLREMSEHLINMVERYEVVG